VALEVQPALEVHSLAKAFAGNVALHPLSLRIEPGEVRALVGENGSGKSTTIKILSGNYRPGPGGEVCIGGVPLRFGSPESSYALGARFVQQDLGLVDSCTILDNICLTAGFATTLGTVRQRELRRSIARDLAALSIDADPATLVGELSMATKTGVAVARALRANPRSQARLLVLDEPTATLPEDEVAHLLATVRQVSATGVAVLYVTHRLDEVFEIADTITVLRDGRKVADKAVRELDRPSLVHLLVGRELEDARSAAARRHAAAGQRRAPGSQAADPLLAVTGLSAGPLRDFSLSARASEIVGIAGITGSGREAALPAVFGSIPRLGGVVRVDGTPLPPMRPDLAIAAGVAYLPPDRKVRGSIQDASALENLTLANLRPFYRRMVLRRRAEADEGRAWFRRLGVRPADGLAMPLGSFSGGNQQKILFGKWLRCGPRVLLLDEPTQGVDIGAKAELYPEILRAAADGAAVVVASSDIDDLRVLCDRVLVLRRGALAAELTGADVTTEAISRECLGTVNSWEQGADI
jgi:ribose transport system ATP-binding protein